MPLAGEEFLAGLCIPHLHVPIYEGFFGGVPGATTAGQAFTVRAKGYAVDTACAPLAGKKWLTRLRIPHPHLPSDLCVLDVIPGTTAGGQALAIRAEGHALDVPAVGSAEGARFRTGGRIPDLHGPAEGTRGQPGPIRTEHHAGD